MLECQFYSEQSLPEVNQAVGNFVSELIWGEPDKFGPFCSLAIANKYALVAGVIYHNYQPECGTIEISCAARNKRWMTRDIITKAMSMPFKQLGCQAILARHSVDNMNARHIWQSLGATEYIIPRLRGKNQPPEVVTVLTDDAWAQSKFNSSNIIDAVASLLPLKG